MLYHNLDVTAEQCYNVTMQMRYFVLYSVYTDQNYPDTGSR